MRKGREPNLDYKTQQKAKLAVIALIFLSFSLFSGLQAAVYGQTGFVSAFFITLGGGAFLFLLQTEYYMFASKHYIEEGLATTSDFQNPLDIWLFALPIAVLMALSYLWLAWHIVQVYFCTMIALTGMIFGNSLGRGAKRWSIRKSLPFFFGAAMSTAFAFIMEGWMG